MQVIILCGGTGTRLREMTELTPKALIKIGGRPIAWHIMKMFRKHGFEEFVLALGYMQEAFKEYFHHYAIINNDIEVSPGLVHYALDSEYEDQLPQSTILVDTGRNTMKGARLKRVQKYVQGDDFMLCYGDGLSDINFKELVKFHMKHGKVATITGVHPAPRFGEIRHRKDKVLEYTEKQDNKLLVNGGFYVFNKKIFDYLTEDESCDLEVGPLEKIASEGQMRVYEHKWFWGCCDTLRDLEVLQKMWDSGNAQWETWKR
jgi:glucose-1-phosphate cytidylyltransferase